MFTPAGANVLIGGPGREGAVTGNDQALHQLCCEHFPPGIQATGQELDSGPLPGKFNSVRASVPPALRPRDRRPGGSLGFAKVVLVQKHAQALCPASTSPPDKQPLSRQGLGSFEKPLQLETCSFEESQNVIHLAWTRSC